MFFLAFADPPKTKTTSERIKELEERQSKFPPNYNKFSYPQNESEWTQFKDHLQFKSLSELKAEQSQNKNTNKSPAAVANEYGIDVGKRMGNKIELRSFHDRLYSEPRGKINTHVRKTVERRTNEGNVINPVFLVRI